jgi:type I restriction enzyme S subunit
MNWQTIKLGNILERKKNLVEIRDNEEYKLVTVRLFHKGVTLRKVAKGSELSSSKMHSVKKGEFILSGIDARHGAFGIIPAELEGAVVSNDFWCLAFDENIIEKHFFLKLTSTTFFDDLCKKASEGTTNRVRLQADKFFNLEITLPPIEEQKDFVRRYSKFEETNHSISTELNHQLASVKELRQAYLREAMQGKLTRQDSADEPAEILLEKIKAEKEKFAAEKRIRRDKPLPPINAEEIPFEIPSNWTWCRLGETSEITRGKSPKYSETGLFKMLNQKCVRWFSIDKSHAKAIEKEWFETVKEDFIVRSGDILVNSTGEGTIGRSAIADSEVDGFIFDSHILKLRSRINQNYICYFINSDFGQSLVESLKGATSTKQTELGVNNLTNFTLPLPPLAEQEKIVAKLETLMKFCEELEANIRESKTQAETLLQVALKEALEPK